MLKSAHITFFLHASWYLRHSAQNISKAYQRQGVAFNADAYSVECNAMVIGSSQNGCSDNWREQFKDKKI